MPDNIAFWGKSLFQAIPFHTIIKLQAWFTKVDEYLQKNFWLP